MTNFVNAGPTLCCYQDGIYSKIVLLRSLDKWICSSRSTLDWVRASLHAVLAPSTSMGFSLLITRVCRRWLAPEVLPWHQKERTTQRLHEERVGRFVVLIYGGKNLLVFLSVSYFVQVWNQSMLDLDVLSLIFFDELSIYFFNLRLAFFCLNIFFLRKGKGTRY